MVDLFIRDTGYSVQNMYVANGVWSARLKIETDHVRKLVFSSSLIVFLQIMTELHVLSCVLTGVEREIILMSTYGVLGSQTKI